MEIAAGLIKVKSGSDETIYTWSETIQSRMDEALLTLKDEGVEIESWFELEIKNEKYLLWYMRAISIEKVWKAFEKSKHEIDHFHLQSMTSITDEVILTKPLLDICSSKSASKVNSNKSV